MPFSLISEQNWLNHHESERWRCVSMVEFSPNMCEVWTSVLITMRRAGGGEIQRRIMKATLHLLCSQTSSNPPLGRMNTTLASGPKKAGIFLFLKTRCFKRLKEWFYPQHCIKLSVVRDTCIPSTQKGHRTIRTPWRVWYQPGYMRP